jgi:hypothetical protein
VRTVFWHERSAGPVAERPRHGARAVTAALAPVRALPVEHVLVSHGPLRLGDGAAALAGALDAPAG